MAKIMEIVNFVLTNKANIAAALTALILAAEAVVRITPTQTDDGAVQRVGGWITSVLNFLKLPNNVK